VISLITGEILLEPNYFRSIQLIPNTNQVVMATTTNFFDYGHQYRYGVFCLYTQTFLTDLIFSDRPQYRNGMLFLRRQHYNAIISIPDGEMLIPSGRFVSIFIVNSSMAAVRQTWSGGTALIDVRTGEIIIDYGRFDDFGILGLLDSNNFVEVYSRIMGGSGIYNLNTSEVIWRQDLTDEEWHDGPWIWSHAVINALPTDIYEARLRLLEQYDQVVHIGDGRFLVRDGAISRFVLPD